jgi:hypothetical protein
MTLAVRWRFEKKPTTSDTPERPPVPAPASKDGWKGWRAEVAVLGLVLLGIAIFFGGYAAGMKDTTFHTNWYSPLRGTGRNSAVVGSVQGGIIDPGGNTPLLVTVRGLKVLPHGEPYVLYELRRDGRPPARCGEFTVGPGRTQVKMSFPGLPRQPYGWAIARERKGSSEISEIVARTPGTK